MQYFKKNRGSLITGAIFAFVPAIMSVYSIEIKSFFDSIFPILFWLVLIIIILAFFYIGYKVYAKIEKLNQQIKNLESDLNHSSILVQKQNTLINQLQKLNIASVKKIFSEFERVKYDKKFVVNIVFCANIMSFREPSSKENPFCDVVYTWVFTGKSLTNIQNAHFTREISSDRYIDVNSLNLQVERTINEGAPKLLTNNANGYNFLHKQGLDDTKGLDIFLADDLLRGDTFNVKIEYRIKSNYRLTGDRFLVFPFTFDDSDCDELTMILKSNEPILRGATLEYIDSESTLIERKILEKFDDEYRLTFNQDCKNYFSGYYEIKTFID